MASNKSTTEKIELQREKMVQMENELKRLMRQQKEEERKARTRRICQRGGLIESLLPDTIILSDERFKAFLEKTIANKFGRDMLSSLKTEQEKETAQNTETPHQQGEKVSIGKLAGMGQNADGSNAVKPTEPPRSGGAAAVAEAPETEKLTG